jgi:hypothetical protein
MPYKERLNPWVLVRLLSQHATITSIFTAHFEYLESQIDRATHQT